MYTSTANGTALVFALSLHQRKKTVMKYAITHGLFKPFYNIYASLGFISSELDD